MLPPWPVSGVHPYVCRLHSSVVHDLPGLMRLIAGFGVVPRPAQVVQDPLPEAPNIVQDAIERRRESPTPPGRASDRPTADRFSGLLDD